MNIELIKNIFKSTNTQAINKQLKLHIDIKNQCEVYLLKHIEFETIQNIIKYILLENKLELPKCKHCNKTLIFRQYQLKQTYCSRECKKVIKPIKHTKEEINQLRKETCLKKYRS